MRVVWYEKRLRVSGIARGSEISLRCRTFAFRSSRNEKDGDAERARRLKDLQSRPDRRILSAQIPGMIAASRAASALILMSSSAVLWMTCAAGS